MVSCEGAKIELKFQVKEMLIKTNKKRPKSRMTKKQFKRELPLHLMVLIPAVFVLVFSYGSMAGIVMAFQDYIPGRGFYVFGSARTGKSRKALSGGLTFFSARRRRERSSGWRRR